MLDLRSVGLTMTRVRLTQLDGKLPNLALMKLAHYHRERGDEIVFSKDVHRGTREGHYGHVYGSAIFSYSAPRVAEFRVNFPDAIVGGTHNLADPITVEQVLGLDAEVERYDYSIYPNFDASIGFTQRGCRLKCGFCVVPKKEGKPRSVNTIEQIWRGEPWPKHLHLLDNDFFGQPRELWQARIAEIKAGGFKVCFNQGINIRMIDDESAAALASIPLYDDSFQRQRLYTAWDNIGDEERFFRGVDTLERHGVRPSILLVYMLVGYDKRETWERVLYRFNRMAERGIRPFPMIYGNRNRGLPLGGANANLEARTLADFQRWAVRRLYTVTPFQADDTRARNARSAISKTGPKRWITRLIRARDLNLAARLVGIRLALSLNPHTGRCDLPYSKLARITGISERSAIRAVADLERAGWAAVIRSAGGRARCNQFAMLSPARKKL
jgi:hypothetical protein